MNDLKPYLEGTTTLDGDVPKKDVHFSAGLLAKNTAYNLLGQGIPLMVSFMVIPLVIKGVGVEKYGIITLAWLVVGYFGLFDFGLGRATTKYVSESISDGRVDLLVPLVWTSLVMLFFFGMAGGAIVAAISPWLVNRFLAIPVSLLEDTQRAFFFLAMAIPLVLIESGIRGVLEGKQEFGIINSIKIFANVLTTVSPLVVLFFSSQVNHIVAVMIAGRMLSFILFAGFCFRSLPVLKKISLPQSEHLKKLVGFGGWLTVSNVIGPLMMYMDRFVIGSLLGMSAVTYYSTPYDVVTKLWIICGSMVGVLFPAFSAYSVDHMESLLELKQKALKYVLILVTPVVFGVIAFANPFLDFWLGAEFARQSTLIMQILAVGILINSVAQVPFTAIQAMGRTDVTAKFHLIELPFYLCAMWLLIGRFGIAGIALAWLARVALDAVLLSSASRKMGLSRHMDRDAVIRKLGIAATGLLALAFLISLLNWVFWKAVLIALSLLIVSILIWTFAIDPAEKLQLKQLTARLR